MRAFALGLMAALGFALPVQAQTQTQTQAPVSCREFSTTIVVDGKRQPAYGTACQQPDGSWRIVNDLGQLSDGTPSATGPTTQTPAYAYPYPDAYGYPYYYPYAYYGDPFLYGGAFIFVDRFGRRHFGHFGDRFGRGRFARFDRGFGRGFSGPGFGGFHGAGGGFFPHGGGFGHH